MMKSAVNPSYSLTFDDAVEVWHRHWNEEFQQHIAADYRVNAGRVNEVLKGKRHVGSREVALRKRM